MRPYWPTEKDETGNDPKKAQLARDVSQWKEVVALALWQVKRDLDRLMAQARAEVEAGTSYPSYPSALAPDTEDIVNNRPAGSHRQ